MLEKWRGFVDKVGYGGGVLMDLSKAFETLGHDLLIAKLQAYGFSKMHTDLYSPTFLIDGRGLR